MKFSKLVTSRAGRVVMVAVPVAAVATVMMAGVAQGAVPVSFSISGQPFSLTASDLEGTSFSEYAGTATNAAGDATNVAIANIGSASLTDLCQSVVAHTPAGVVGLLITAGDGGTPATASDLQIGMTDLQGDAVFKNIRIGVDASQVQTSVKGSAGEFAQDADSVSIHNLKQSGLSVTAGVFDLANLHMQITNGSKTCG